MVDIEKNSDDTPADEGGYILKWTHGQPEGHDYTILTGPKYWPSHHTCFDMDTYACMQLLTSVCSATRLHLRSFGSNRTLASFWPTASQLASSSCPPWQLSHVWTARVLGMCKFGSKPLHHGWSLLACHIGIECLTMPQHHVWATLSH